MLSIFRKYYQFIFRYKKTFFAFIFILFFSFVIQNLNPFFYKLLVDNLRPDRSSFLLKIVFLIVGAKILAELLESAAQILGDKVFIPASRDARIAIFRHLQDLDLAFHVNKSTGSLISAFKRGDAAFWNYSLNLHLNVFSILVGLGVTLFFFNRIDPLFTLLMLSIFGGNILIGWKLIKNNIQKRSELNKEEDKVSAVITDSLLNYETVKFFAQEEKEEKRLRERFEDWLDKFWQFSLSFRKIDITIGTLSNLGTLIILYLAVKKLKRGAIGAGDFIMIASFINGFYYRFFQLIYQLRGIAKNYTDIKRYFSLLDKKVLVKDPRRPIKIKRVKGEIKFEKVSFSYPQKKEIALKDINLIINPGETVAFVGRSGAGKTTLIRLLLRFYDVEQGEISIDGIDLKRVGKRRLRSFIGVVPQEPILFNNTIGYNIGYGQKNPSLAKIIQAAKLANLDHFIRRLPQQYQTLVGERGVKLSGGQKQRLAIARMILSHPRIIIFDEATSNLDSESERLIQKSLEKIAPGKTVLIIAHRFSTIRKANRIVVLDQGEIVEEGNHTSLLAKKGLYAYLWRLQNKHQYLDT